MFSIEEFIIAVFCGVDDLLKEIMQGQPLRAKGFALALAVCPRDVQRVHYEH